MEEVTNPDQLLEQLKPYPLTPFERVLIGHTGTVQLLLSLWFNTPVGVRLMDQQDGVGAETNPVYASQLAQRPLGDPPLALARTVELYRESDKQHVAVATSVIPIGVNRHDVLALVRAGDLGLGQIAAELAIPTVRIIEAVEVTDETVGRRYRMVGDGLWYLIQETFPRRLYR